MNKIQLIYKNSLFYSNCTKEKKGKRDCFYLFLENTGNMYVGGMEILQTQAQD